MPDILNYVAIGLLIVISAFFSATEISFASLNKNRLQARYDENKKLSYKLACKISDNYSENLGAVLIGNNLANNAASSIATVIVLDLLGDNYAWVATVVMTLLVLTFGEVIPKVLAIAFAEKFAVIVSIPMYCLSLILRPVTWLIMLFVNLVSKLWEKSVTDIDAVSEDDLENIIDIAENEGVLDEDNADLLQNALDFDEVLAYEIVTPRVDMEAIDIRDPYEVNIKKILETTYSRMPVFEDTPDKIIGVLHLNKVYKELVDGHTISIRDMLIPVTYVHKNMPIPDVLEIMKENMCHMVVVLDEYGGTKGILTMEDILEQLVGEIWDETDDIEREFVCVDDTHFIADGDMRIYDFFDEFDMDIEDDEDFDVGNSTVGGWVTTMLEGEVEKNNSFTYENLKIAVMQSDEKRVAKISVEVLPAEEEEED